VLNPPHRVAKQPFFLHKLSASPRHRSVRTINCLQVEACYHQQLHKQLDTLSPTIIFSTIREISYFTDGYYLDLICHPPHNSLFTLPIFPFQHLIQCVSGPGSRHNPSRELKSLAASKSLYLMTKSVSSEWWTHVRQDGLDEVGSQFTRRGRQCVTLDMFIGSCPCQHAPIVQLWTQPRACIRPPILF
jgi:hypothetical protein